ALLFALGNEIPAGIVRWHGHRRIERFLRELYEDVKAAAPDSLLTYVNFPPTEHLELDAFDVFAYNVYLHRETELRGYLEANTGKFTYIKPPHYIGNTFVQEAIYAHNPDGNGAEPFQRSVDEIPAEELARLIAPGLDYLRDLEPLLLDAAGGTPRYPEDNAALDGLFLNGEVDFNCKFGLYAVATGLATGSYPQAATQFVFPDGNMIKNKNYLAVPSNTPNPAAAMVFVNYMTSPEAQTSKLQFAGMPAGIDGWKLSDEQAAALAEASPGTVGVTQEELDANVTPDTNATLVDVIEATWLEYIERDSQAPIADIVTRAAGNLSK
ncbi:MAG: extracellular solute-binding protein, partial [Paracoccus sp. (in: a-proteobacteria)]